ncbi:hypothetical protein MRX96_052864 [Rhipicephalus microplus]
MARRQGALLRPTGPNEGPEQERQPASIASARQPSEEGEVFGDALGHNRIHKQPVPEAPLLGEDCEGRA